MKGYLFTLIVSLVVFTIGSKSLQGQNQYSFGDTYVKGIKVVIDQEQKNPATRVTPQSQISSRLQGAKITGQVKNNGASGIVRNNQQTKLVTQKDAVIMDGQIKSQGISDASGEINVNQYLRQEN